MSSKISAMALWRTGAGRFVLVTILWLLLTAVCWKFSILPGVVLFGGASLVAVVGYLTISSHRVLWVNIGGIAAVFLVAELYCRIVLHGGPHAKTKAPMTPSTIHQVQDTQKPDDSWVKVQEYHGGEVYWSPEILETTEKDHLQYKPNAKARSKRVVKGRTVYDVTYTTNEYGFRVTPAAIPGKPTVAFWGCSYVFGRGLNDDQTLPNQFVLHSGSRFSVINFGLSGHAPNSTLAMVEGSRERPSTAGSNIVAGVYVTMSDHPRRVLGGQPWTQGFPRYVLRNGVPVRDGVITHEFKIRSGARGYRENVTYNLGKSALLDVLMKEWDDRNSVLANILIEAWAYRNFDLYAAILKRSAEIFEARYHAPFVVVAWLSDSHKDRAICQALVHAGLRVIDLNDLMRNNVIVIPNDGHPSAFGNRLIADMLLAYLEAMGVGAETKASSAATVAP